MSKVLVVDDELDICLMITRHLQKLSFDTAYTHTVRDAHSMLSETPYDVMFLDLNLKDGSGLDVLQFANEMNVHPKVVVISAYDGEASKVIDAGASHFIAKPFAIRRIDETLEKLNFLPKQ